MIKEAPKVVIQLTDSRPEVIKATHGQIQNLREALPEVMIEIVVHSKATQIFLKGNQDIELMEGIVSDRVKLLVCRHALDGYGIEADDVPSFAEVIPSAVAHLVIRQQEGWSYLKSGF